MSFPIVYDVLMRTEVEARSPADAASMVAGDIAEFGIETAVSLGLEVIRDDNVNPPKDIHSRHINGFAVFTSSQKLELITKIAAALDAAARGNKAPGDALLAQLANQFVYLNNDKLDGVQV